PALPTNPRRRRVWFELFYNRVSPPPWRPPPLSPVVRQCNAVERALALPRGSTVLDIGCGLGLHAVELAVRGYLVVGIDVSLPMLSRAADEAQERGLHINFLHGDMREMSFDGEFDAVICLGTTFGYFDDDTNR